MESKGKKKKVRKRGVRISSATKKKIKQLRISEDFTIGDLADKTGISERTLRNLEKIGHPQKHFDETIISFIAESLNVTLATLLKDEQKDTLVNKDNIDLSFEFLVEQFMEIDQNLLMVIRDHKHASRKIVEQEFKDCLYMRLKERNISLELLNRNYKNPVNRNILLETVPKPCLSIEISENFDRLLFKCDTGEELLIKNPKLLWDCHCDTNQIYKCPIHSNSTGKEVEVRLQTGYVLIKYGETRFLWRNTRDLWPPSIDSFHMLNVMKEDGLFENRYSSVLDIGSGTGFLGIVTAIENKFVQEITLSDWLLTPYLYGTINWFMNRKNKQYVQLKANVGLFTMGIYPTTTSYDIAICNPPYIPLLDDYRDIGMEATVAGTDLLKNVIIESKSLAKKTYIQFSNLAKKEAFETAEKTDVKLKPVGRERLIPFRLRILWKRPDYLEKLVKEKGLIDNQNESHRFWHKIQTYVIE